MKPSLLEAAGLKTTALVAEVKTKSPFGFESKRSWEELMAMARLCGDIISIHVDYKWGGDYDLINRAKAILGETKIAPPILAKGLIIEQTSVHELVKRGASHVLVKNFDLLNKFEPGVCWFELPSTLHEISQLTFQRQHVYVVNARDLTTGKEVTEDLWSYVRRLHQGPLIQASFVESVDQIKPDANGVIVGEHLPDLLVELNDYAAIRNKKDKKKGKKKK